MTKNPKLEEIAQPRVCRFCGGPDTEMDPGKYTGTCDRCYWQMRFNPVAFEARMEKLGRPVKPVDQVRESPDGGVMFVSPPNPFEPVDNGQPLAGQLSLAIVAEP